MDQFNPERKSSPEPREADRSTFADKFKELLPGVEFEESGEMAEARMAVLEALARHDQNPGFLRSIWAEYARICEQTVDSKTPSDADPQIRARLQIAALVHKALILLEIGDVQRYEEDLTDAENYALAKHLDEIAGAIGAELDNLH